MKKIAADNNYRMLKRAAPEGEDPTRESGPSAGPPMTGDTAAEFAMSQEAEKKRRRRPRRARRQKAAPQAAGNNAQLIAQAKKLTQQLSGVLNKLK
jgi:hypothetical protein